MASKRQRGTDGSHDTKLSKGLSWLLRHGAMKEGLNITPGGFVLLDDILNHPKYKHYSVADVQKVVADNDKQRFTLTTSKSGKLMIRANQGHTIPVEELELTEIDPEGTPFAIHGTFARFINKIKSQGLSRMSRQHVHMAAGMPGHGEVISGMRATCDYVVTVNIAKAAAAGIKFYRSSNNVILSPGNEAGIIPSEFFSSVKRRTD